MEEKKQEVVPAPETPEHGKEPIPGSVQSFLNQPHGQKPLETHHTHTFFTWMLLIIIIVLLVLSAGFGYFLWQRQSVPFSAYVKSPLPTIPPTPTPEADPTANWHRYSDAQFSFKYPNGWQVKKEGASVMVFDPTSEKEKPTSGNGTVKYFENAITISVAASQQTTKAAADAYEAQWKKTVSDLHREQVDIGGLQAEVMDEEGEGSNGGKYVIVSNGSYLAQINASLKDVNGDSTTNKILSTFKFAETTTPEDAPAVSPSVSVTIAPSATP